jgi:hypothetical protein
MWYFFGAIGLLSIFGGIRLISHGLRSYRWPTTFGIVKSSEVERHSTSGPNKATSFAPKVVYQYNVQGKKFESDHLSYKVMGGSAERCWRIVNKYPVGSEVKAYYHPSKPGLAVLVPGLSILSYMPLFFGAVLTILAGLGIAGIL